MWQDVREFLDCYDIDAVCGGVPFVDIFDAACEWRSDQVGRPVVRLAVTPRMPVRKFRKLTEMVLARFPMVQRFMDRGTAKWRGSYFMERDKRIYQEMKRLRAEGMRVEEAYEIIAEAEYLSPYTIKKIVLAQRRLEKASSSGGDGPSE